MPAGPYPIPSFHFSVDFIGKNLNSKDVRFQSVSGLSVSIETEEFREGGENRFKHKLPTFTAFQPLELKRALVSDSPLVTWCRNAIENFTFAPANLLIKLLNEAHQPLVTWNVVNAFPIRWSVSDLDAQKSELVIETLQLQYNYFNRVKPKS